MDWRIKCAAFHVLPWLPGQRHVYRWMQRNLTGRYFFDLTDAELSGYRFHVEQFRGGRALEFGCGSNLLTPLLLSAAGATEVLAYDIERLATIEQVNYVIRQLRGRVGGEWPEITSLDDLQGFYRISYRAPADVRSTGLREGCVDFICSTSVLEHIPEAGIRTILIECRRLAAPQAIMSFIIDYHDHYATADPAITRFHFYRFGPSTWRLFNPGNHYQNRLRHSDYIRLFAAEGLSPISTRCVIPADSPAGIDNLARCFRGYSHDDLVALNGFFVLHR